MVQDKKIRHKDILKLDFVKNLIEILFENEVEGFDLLDNDCKATINGILSGEIKKVEWSVSNARGIVIQDEEGNIDDIAHLIRKRKVAVKDMVFSVLDETMREKVYKDFLEYFANEEDFSEEKLTLILNEDDNQEWFNEFVESQKNKYIVNNWKRIEEQIFEYTWQGIDKMEVLVCIDKYLKNTFGQIDDFCSANNIDIITEIKLFNIARVHAYTARIIIHAMKLLLIIVSDIDRVLEIIKDFHREENKISPDGKGFRSYLYKYVDSLSELSRDENIEKRIAEYVHHKLNNNKKYNRDAKLKMELLFNGGGDDKKKDKVTKTIHNVSGENVIIRDYFADAIKTDKTQTKALHSTLKAMGITKDDMVLYKRQQNRVRIMLERIGKWEKKITAKPQSK
jgi:hypothetical protein